MLLTDMATRSDPVSRSIDTRGPVTLAINR